MKNQNSSEFEEIRRIGDSVSEILIKGFTVQIDPPSTGAACVLVVVHDEDAPVQAVYMSTDTNKSVADKLEEAVDAIRAKRGEPSVEEEVATLLKEDSEFAALPPFFFGPKAACVCGSREPLQINFTTKWGVDWGTGCFVTDSIYISDSQRLTPKPGEIMTCPDCGKSYRASA